MQKRIETSEFYESVDLITTPIILTDNGTKCQYVNKAFLSQIGYNTTEIPDQETWFNKVHPDAAYRQEVKEKWQQCLELAKSNGDTHLHMITRICCADGSFKWFDIHENVFGNNKVISFLDVNELQQANEKLTDVLKQKDILLSIIAHDIRSPLSNVMQIVNNYKELDLSEQEIEGIFFSMGAQIDYIFTIINSLLVRTSVERGVFIEKSELINLKAFLSKYSAYYKDRLEKKNIEVICEVTGNVTVNYDPFILDVIFRNLIDNAIKYTPENGVIYISHEELENCLELTIRDSGPGMTTDQIERILNNVGSRSPKNQMIDSFGLGLVMAKEILEQHKGKLSIKSELGKGTSFIINI